MFTAAGPFYVASHPASSLISGLVFGLGLILVVFAGGELATSAMMALPQAAALRRITWGRASLCLAIWAQSRIANDVAKMVLMAWCMFAFVTSGFEHVVANMTTVSLGVFFNAPGVQAAGIVHNLVFVGLGNLVGGALFVGAVYLFIAHQEAADH